MLTQTYESTPEMQKEQTPQESKPLDFYEVNKLSTDSQSLIEHYKKLQTINTLLAYSLFVVSCLPIIYAFVLPEIQSTPLKIITIVALIFSSFKLINFFDEPKIYNKIISVFKTTKVIKQKLTILLKNPENIQLLLKVIKHDKHSKLIKEQQLELYEAINNIENNQITLENIEFIMKQYARSHYINQKLIQKANEELTIKKLEAIASNKEGHHQNNFDFMHKT